MVGKGVDAKSSRIFHQCYLKCCKLQNLTPLNNVIPSNNGKVLDFCVDRIKYVEWAPILNALSCDLSLHSVSIRCRQQVKTVLEQIDCERLAKTVTKRAVILTNFMLNNLVEAIAQMLSSTTLLSTLLIEGLPLKIPYLNPLCETLGMNSSLQHLYLPRCLVGDAGCLAICKAVRGLPNILTLDLSACEITPLGAGYLADLLKYQKINRYSENWVHTLRYRLPELDTMAGLRRITLCGNPSLADQGFATLAEVLADDLWIKALDVQNCGLTELSASAAMRMMQSNTTLVILDMRHNPDISIESISKLRSAVRNNERGMGGQYSWLSNASSSDGRSTRSSGNKNGMVKDRGVSNVRNVPNKYSNKASTLKKEKDYTELLEEQLQEEISHRQQLEELNMQLVDQMKQLKQQQMRMWANAAKSSGSEQSLAPSSTSGGDSSSSSSCSVPIDHSTLSYIQRAFRDIYTFIKNNQCHGQCRQEQIVDNKTKEILDDVEISETTVIEQRERIEHLLNIIPKKAQSSHQKVGDDNRMKKMTKSAHLLGDTQRVKGTMNMTPGMFERQMGDTITTHCEEVNGLEEITGQCKGLKGVGERSECNIPLSDSSDTLVCSPAPRPRHHPRPSPHTALLSSSDDSD